MAHDVARNEELFDDFRSGAETTGEEFAKSRYGGRPGTSTAGDVNDEPPTFLTATAFDNLNIMDDVGADFSGTSPPLGHVTRVRLVQFQRNTDEPMVSVINLYTYK